MALKISVVPGVLMGEDLSTNPRNPTNEDNGPT
jgi:hypothetical protein